MIGSGGATQPALLDYQAGRVQGVVDRDAQQGIVCRPAGLQAGSLAAIHQPAGCQQLLEAVRPTSCVEVAH